MESFLVVLGVIFVVVIVLAFSTDVGKDPSKKTDAQLQQVFPLHVKNVAAQKKVSAEAYTKALGDFAALTNELVKRGLRTEYEVTDFDLAQNVLSEKFNARLPEVIRRASDGDLDALYHLAVAKITTQEEESAFRLLVPVADQGHVEAQYLLGHGYLNAKRVPKNAVESLKWLLIAGANGHKDAIAAAGVLEKSLPDEISQEAKKKALEWTKLRPVA
jgi:TPR repeat protein